MDFNPNQHIAIVKAIIELTDMSDGSDLELTKSLMHERERYEDDVFYKEDTQIQSNIILDLFTLQPLSMTWNKARVGGSGSSLNIILPLYSLG